MLESFLGGELAALFTVILIDIVLAGDNAVVVGLAAAGLPPHQQRKVIVWGIAIAFVARVLFAIVALQLLAIIGLLLAGGILLLWVAWKMYRELRPQEHADPDAQAGRKGPAKTFGSAVVQVAVADVSMSLDNVLAVAGAARDHMTVMIIGLALSIALMGLAAGYIARLMDRHRWIAYVGLVVVLYVALSMIWDGGQEVWTAVH
ncbi:MAG: YjbE family putative metal transport protein [Geminicoccaceae bacterium]|nr:YjbE family putative metal transport protein [Geminicoccaceae bacterium]